MAAIFLRPGHADPAAFADPLGKAGNVAVAALRVMRIEGAGRDFIGEESADFLAQSFAFGRQADGIETERCGHFRICPEFRCNFESKSPNVGAAEVRSLSHGER